jgi:hypothetical protein
LEAALASTPQAQADSNPKGKKRPRPEPVDPLSVYDFPDDDNNKSRGTTIELDTEDEEDQILDCSGIVLPPIL